MHLTGLQMVDVGKNHKYIVGDEPMGSPTQGSEAFRPDVPESVFLSNTWIRYCLGLGKLV